MVEKNKDTNLLSKRQAKKRVLLIILCCVLIWLCGFLFGFVLNVAYKSPVKNFGSKLDHISDVNKYKNEIVSDNPLDFKNFIDFDNDKVSDYWYLINNFNLDESNILTNYNNDNFRITINNYIYFSNNILKLNGSYYDNLSDEYSEQININPYGIKLFKIDRDLLDLYEDIYLSASALYTDNDWSELMFTGILEFTNNNVVYNQVDIVDLSAYPFRKLEKDATWGEDTDLYYYIIVDLSTDTSGFEYIYTFNLTNDEDNFNFIKDNYILTKNEYENLLNQYNDLLEQYENLQYENNPFYNSTLQYFYNLSLNNPSYSIDITKEMLYNQININPYQLIYSIVPTNEQYDYVNNQQDSLYKLIFNKPITINNLNFGYNAKLNNDYNYKITFIFEDNTSWTYNNPQSSTINNYLQVDFNSMPYELNEKRVISMTFQRDYSFVITGIYSDSYYSGFVSGEQSGEKIGYRNGYNVGVEKGKEDANSIITIDSASYQNGYSVGYHDGANSSNVLASMIWAVADVPFLTFKNIFGFDILGINLANFVLGVITLLLVIYLIKKLL